MSNSRGEFDGFRPMPKRFMVWDRINNDWEDWDGQIFDLLDFRYLLHTNFLEYSDGNKIIVQSTNLFDKDGKEIFEGTILEMEGESDNGLEFRSGYPVYGYVYNNEGRWHLKVYENGRLINDEYSLKEALDDDTSRVVGHILYSPELLEGQE